MLVNYNGKEVFATEDIISVLKALQLCQQKNGQRPVLERILVRASADYIIFVGLDGHIGIEYKIIRAKQDTINKALQIEYGFTIDFEAVDKLNQESHDVYIALDKKQRSTFNCGFVDYREDSDNYPNYENVMPCEFATDVHPIFTFDMLKKIEKIYKLLDINVGYFKPQATTTLGATMVGVNSVDAHASVRMLVMPCRTEPS